MKNLLIFLLISTTSFAQNKKEQIEILNFRVDSLNTVLATTRDNSAKDISILNDKINNLQAENNKLKLDLVDLASFPIKKVRVGNLEVMTEDLEIMNWHEAREVCENLGDGWRLPTKDELNILYENKDKIGGFASDYYWSSTELEIENGTAWRQYFTSGNQLSDWKQFTNYVRAVRGF